MIIPPRMKQDELFDNFMPKCIDDFFQGYNVNVIAYGQTGTGKTHTMFGPPGCMKRAARGEYSYETHQTYGLFPRGILEIFRKVHECNTTESQSSSSNIYALTCSAVELCHMGNEDMFNKSEKRDYSFANGSGSLGIILNRDEKPPRLYGQNEYEIKTYDDILRVFAAIASRNTEGTLLNDTSSRSHCLVALKLWRYDVSTKMVFKTRFQFCDLAGSEKLDKAHSDTSMKLPNGEWNHLAIMGMSTNFSYTELQRCLNDIAIQKKQNRKFNFRAYVTDLLFLLSGSLVGNAITALFVCVSQAESNKAESNYALDFGEKFSKLDMNCQKVKGRLLEDLQKELLKSIDDNCRQIDSASTWKNRYTMMRKAQVRDCEQILNVLKNFSEEKMGSVKSMN
ncbi:kinesin-like protein KIFC3 isoform X2 [Clytia hemisphaerica]